MIPLTLHTNLRHFDQIHQQILGGDIHLRFDDATCERKEETVGTLDGGGMMVVAFTIAGSFLCDEIEIENTTDVATANTTAVSWGILRGNFLTCLRIDILHV